MDRKGQTEGGVGGGMCCHYWLLSSQELPLGEGHEGIYTV